MRVHVVLLNLRNALLASAATGCNWFHDALPPLLQLRGSGTTHGAGSFAANGVTRFLVLLRLGIMRLCRFHFPQVARSHIVQTRSELGSCWRLSGILVDRARSWPHHSASYRNRGVVLACRRCGIQYDPSRITKMPLRSTTVRLRRYYDATTMVLRLSTIFLLQCTTICFPMSKQKSPCRCWHDPLRRSTNCHGQPRTNSQPHCDF